MSAESAHRLWPSPCQQYEPCSPATCPSLERMVPVGGLASDVRAVVGVVLGAAVVAVVEARRGAVVVVSSLVPMADVVVVVSSTGAVVVVVSGSVDVVVPA